MRNQVIGPGIGLPAPQNLFPSQLTNIAYTPSTNAITLNAGDSILIPAGKWNIVPGKYSLLEIQDPVETGSSPTATSGVWRPVLSTAGRLFQIDSDGFNYRISNLLGCPVAAIVTNGGATYTSTTTVTPSSGNSTWTPIIGGRLGPMTFSSPTQGGSGYGVTPIVNIAAPQGPGVQATASAHLSTSGIVDAITIVNAGAGYTAAPAVTIVPNPFDPNLASTTAIVAATATANLTGSGSVSAVLCTNNGAPNASNPPSITLTISGGNNSASATALCLSTITAITVSAIGSGTITGALITTAQGVPTATPAFANALAQLTDFVPRAAIINVSVDGGGGLSPNSATITDGGLFLGTATPLIITYGGAVWNPVGTVTLTQGSTSDTVYITPA